MEIVHTYSDEGKSGLNIQGRDSSGQMIRDVESGSTDFACILIYDVSRWGRFQDADESAYYEYICRRADIPVHYRAEQFENDGSPVSKHARRLICDAIFYLVRAGCARHLLLTNFPPWKTVCHYLRAWRLAGVWVRLHGRLRSLCRTRAGRSARPTAAIIDRQSAKTSERGGVHGWRRGQEGQRAQTSSTRRQLGAGAWRAGARG